MRITPQPSGEIVLNEFLFHEIKTANKKDWVLDCWLVKVGSLCFPLLLHAYIMRKYACYIPIIM